ncbi:MAG TPA: glucoamylase family protein [Kofleriaceae bacterium]|nr:glucoamylase family protein [Kofleriaceae bacterium]
MPTTLRSFALATALIGTVACAPARLDGPSPAPGRADESRFLDTLQERTFRWFWDSGSPETGLVPDRWPSPSFSSIAAVGFGLTAYPVGVERGHVTREQARERTLATLRFFWRAPQGPEARGRTGHRGFFYHFLDMKEGLRYRDVELSTIDTALFIAGALAAAAYFDGPHPGEQEIRRLADQLYRRVEWDWFQVDSPLVSMAWRPEREFDEARYEGYDEAMLLYVLALGSPTHPIQATAWPAFTSTYSWGDFHGQEHVNFAPLFGHQYSHVWIDTRGIQDAYMRERGIDYFENSRRATLSQRAYAIENRMRWKGYDGQVWGLTASSGPVDATHTIDGVERTFHTYWARGAARGDVRDDGTISPTAVGGSIPFAPELTIAALQAMRARYGEHVFRKYGFVDAFNPTLDRAVAVKHGRIVPGVGWFEDDYLGIDQGPILLMAENHRSGLVWRLMRSNPHVVRGLCRAGFTGGWLKGRCR